MSPVQSQASIKAVFFDFDGVLTRDKTGSQTTLRYLSHHGGIGYDRLREAFNPHNEDLNLGRVSHADIWPEVCQKLGAQLDIGLLPGAFESTPMNQEMLRLAGELKRRYSVGIITDNKIERIAHLKSSVNLASLFDPIVVSAEVGSGKEGPRIFEVALDYLGISPAEAIFIDNTRDNLVAPSALGINTIYFDEGSNDVKALSATLRDAFFCSL